MTLKHRLGSSTLWMSLAATGTSAISFVIFIVLSRILEPRDIGLVAFALIVVELGKILVNAGMSQAIIQRKEWNNTFAATAFYLNFLFSVAVTLVVIFLLAPLIAAYYDPQAENIVKVLAIIFLLDGINAVHDGKLKREFSFRTVAIRTILASLASGVLGVYLAMSGFGVWALVAQQLCSQLCVTLVTQLSARWWPGFTFSQPFARELLRFSTPLMLAQVIANFASKIFELLIGLVIGPAALGFFRVGGRALYILQDILIKPLETTSLAALSRIDESQHQGESLLRVIRVTCCIIFPVFFGAAAIAEEFIILAFGTKWATSAALMCVLAVGLAPVAVAQQINSSLTASGNSRMVMWLAMIGLTGNAVLALSTVPFGLLATAYGFAARNYLTIFFNFYFFRRVYRIGITRLLGVIAPAFISSVLMLATVYAAKIAIAGKLPMLAQLLLSAGLGAVSYGVFMRVLFQREMRIIFAEGLDLAPGKFKPILLRLQGIIKLG
jgi:O-antigen/teichoic acid export membrane protein